MKNVMQKVMLYFCSLIISLQIHEKYFVENAPSIVTLSNLIVSIFLGHPVYGYCFKTRSSSIVLVSKNWMHFILTEKRQITFYLRSTTVLYQPKLNLKLIWKHKTVFWKSWVLANNALKFSASYSFWKLIHSVLFRESLVLHMNKHKSPKSEQVSCCSSWIFLPYC